MVKSRLRVFACVTSMAVLTCSSAHAQTEAEPQTVGQFLLIGASYGGPLRQTFSAGWFPFAEEDEGLVGPVVAGVEEHDHAGFRSR